MSSSYMSSSSYTMAKRSDGVCQGSLWRSFDDNSTPTPTYSLLVGIRLICYESLVCMEAGHHPVATYAVVGASATSSGVGGGVGTRHNATFRVVSNQGTHLVCNAPTRSCRDVWLSALNAGLEYRLQPTLEGLAESSRRMSRPRPKVRGGVLQKAQRYCHSCGKLERLEFPLSPHQAPLPQYGVEEKVDLCRKCDLAQGVVDHCVWVEELYATREQELRAMLDARELILGRLKPRRAAAAGVAGSKGGPETDGTTAPDAATAESEPMTTTKTDVGPVAGPDNPNSGEGSGDEEAAASEIKPPADEVEVHEQTTEPSEGNELSDEKADSDLDDGPERDESGRLLPQSHTLQLKPTSHHLLAQVLASPEGMAFQRISPTFAGLCAQFQQGMVGVMEYMELLEHAIGIRDPAMAELKTQAFRVAGDMGTALKLLYEQCLPPLVSSVASSGLDGHSIHRQKHNDANTGANSTELLQCILEFFLDLVEEGELNTLAFFWPQISNIHLQMLPPLDAAALQKVELLEDFLLTVASKHSIHLAIELVWSHIADLEDAMSGSHHTAPCSQRRFSVLRFMCELESLLFDFDSGWGGGSVTVGQFLAPSNHQIDLLKSSMGRIQAYRAAADQDRLSRSHRLSKLLAPAGEATGGDGSGKLSVATPPEVLAKEALRIAKNADYLSSHLAFTKRLCDLAERLRVLPVADRPEMLQVELSKLNCSGSMGGDPLNKVKKDEQDHTRVVRIPVTEGHVFRSKERTPVLLLVETVDEGAEKGIDLEKKFIRENIRASMSGSAVPTKAEAPAAALGPKAEAFQNGAGSKDALPVPKTEQEHEEEKKEVTPEPALSENDDVVKDPVSDAVDPEEAAADEDGTESSHETDETKEATPVLETTKISGEETVVEDEGRAQEPEETGFCDDVARQVPPVSTEPKQGIEALQDDASLASVPESTGMTLPLSRHGSIRSMRSGTIDLLEGSTDGFNEPSDEPRHALRRFDSPKTEPKIMTPTATRAVIEALVTNAVAKQLDLPNLTTQTEDEEGEEENEEAPQTDQVEVVEAQQQGINSPSLPKPSKMSTLGTSGGSQKEEQFNRLSKTGDTRREVLNAIMMKGMSGSHVIAEQAATGVQRHLQDLERRVAVEALLTEGDLPHGTSPSPDKDEKRKELLSLGIRSVSREDMHSNLPGSDEDEAMDSIRLLLIQYRVATGSITANDAAAVLVPHSRHSAKKHGKGTILHFGREFPEIDAGDIDPRLVGCGVLPPAVLQALTLWKGEMISNGELLELVKKDLEFEKHSKDMERNTDKRNEDSAFWGRFAFGERWAEKRSRLAAKSPDATLPGWDLIGIIVKSNDDLRQESFTMQLIELCQEAFQEAELELWLLPYRIVSTGRTTGIIEMVRNAMSFDALKKRPGYGSGGLREHLQRMTRYAADPSEAFQSAQRNFVRSIAAYSLLSYLFVFKDRHNGNILLDTAGHVIHIDFGFVFGIAPGGNFSLEMSTPFKLTDEMIEVMDGLRSSLFSEFVTLFCCGFLALQAHSGTFMTLVEVTSRGSTFKCFEGRDTAEILGKMQERFRPDLGKEETVAHVLDIIKESIGSYGTKQYDYFQYLSQGIAT